MAGSKKLRKSKASQGTFDESFPRATWALQRMVTSENWRDQSDSDVSGAVATVAYEYDPIAAGNLIRYFHFALQEGELFAHHGKLTDTERGFLDFIAQSFGRYVEKDGKVSLDVAFGISRGRGRLNEDNSERNLIVAASVEWAIRNDKQTHGSAKMELVCKEVANKCSLNWKSVEEIYRDFRDVTEMLGDADISTLADTLTK